MIALILAMLARKRNSIEPALNKAGMQAPNAFARRAEDNGNVRFMETQKVDDAVFNIIRRHCYGLISDVAMPAIRARGDDLQRIALISASQRGNRLWHRSEEHTSELQSLMRNSYAVFCLKKTS